MNFLCWLWDALVRERRLTRFPEAMNSAYESGLREARREARREAYELGRAQGYRDGVRDYGTIVAERLAATRHSKEA